MSDKKCKVFVKKFEGKKVFMKPRHRYKNTVKMLALKENAGCGLDSCCSEYGPVVDFCKHGNGSLLSIENVKFLRCCGY
jgi:hypothetical protein